MERVLINILDTNKFPSPDWVWFGAYSLDAAICASIVKQYAIIKHLIGICRRS